jgi:hypothetical protein
VEGVVAERIPPSTTIARKQPKPTRSTLYIGPCVLSIQAGKFLALRNRRHGKTVAITSGTANIIPTRTSITLLIAGENGCGNRVNQKVIPPKIKDSIKLASKHAKRLIDVTVAISWLREEKSWRPIIFARSGAMILVRLTGNLLHDTLCVNMQYSLVPIEQLLGIAVMIAGRTALGSTDNTFRVKSSGYDGKPVDREKRLWNGKAGLERLNYIHIRGWSFTQSQISY